MNKKVLLFSVMIFSAIWVYAAEGGEAAGEIGCPCVEEVREAFNKAFMVEDVRAVAEILSPLSEEDALYMISQSDQLDGATYLHLAIEMGYRKDMIERLLSFCPDGALWDYLRAVNIATGDTCLHVAAKQHNLIIYRFLMKTCPRVGEKRTKFLQIRNIEGRFARHYLPF